MSASSTHNPGTDLRIEDLIMMRASLASLQGRRMRAPRSQQSGAYRSLARGRGMDFDQVRIYQAGDDIRSIDWRVTARTGKPHTKLYHEERSRPVLLTVDLSSGMRFASRVAFKSILAARCAALMAWQASEDGDRVGGIVFNGDDHCELPPKGRRQGVLALLAAIIRLHAAPSQNQGLGAALQRLVHTTRPGSRIIILSDFQDLDQQGEALLQQLALHNNLLLLPVSDPLERTPPPKGHYRISDGILHRALRFGQETVDHAYTHPYEETQQQLEQLGKRFNIPVQALDTAVDPIPALQQIVALLQGGR